MDSFRVRKYVFDGEDVFQEHPEYFSRCDDKVVFLNAVYE